MVCGYGNDEMFITKTVQQVDATWRIIPFSKRLITMISFRPLSKDRVVGPPSKWPFHGLHHLLTGMILQDQILWWRDTIPIPCIDFLQQGRKSKWMSFSWEVVFFHSCYLVYWSCSFWWQNSLLTLSWRRVFNMLYTIVATTPLAAQSTLPETNSSPLKIGHPKKESNIPNHPFSGAMLVSGRVIDVLFAVDPPTTRCLRKFIFTDPPRSCWNVKITSSKRMLLGHVY